MTKQEKQMNLMSTRIKALENYFNAGRALDQAEKDLMVIDTALEAIKDLIDAPTPTVEQTKVKK